jgi:hypothetical protein
MQRPRASGIPPMAKPKGNPKGKGTGRGARRRTVHLPMSRCTARSRGSSSHLVAGWQREAGAGASGIATMTICGMPDDFVGCRQLPFHSLSNASITGTTPSPNKRGLHFLSVLLTHSLTGWTLHDATTLSDRTH